jgi:hypothetical protein
MVFFLRGTIIRNVKKMEVSFITYVYVFAPAEFALGWRNTTL